MVLSREYAPQIVVKTEGLPREDWLEYRRLGIGGSDAAAVLGISPFQTGRDLYYDKLKIVSANDDDNWVAKKAGTLLEPLVAEIFSYRTGLKVYRKPFMYQHPKYPWMLADLDYLVELPNGKIAILECKTTNPFGKENWWYNGCEIVPLNYEVQGRHYMSVMNIDRVYYCCYYTNTAEEAIIRHTDRDAAYEAELIFLEEDFWTNRVQAHVPPPYIEKDGELILQSIKHRFGPADLDAPPVMLNPSNAIPVLSYYDLRKKKAALSAEVKKLENEMSRAKAYIIEQMGSSCRANYTGADADYAVSYLPSYTTGIPKDKLERLKEVHPDIYNEYVVRSVTRRFTVKKIAAQAA